MRRMSDRNDLKWCGTLFPWHAGAQEAEMSTEEYEDFVYTSGNLHLDDPISAWKELSTKQERLCSLLLHKKSLRILSENTDLKMDITGRKWINCDGKENFPDGEIFTCPHIGSVEGHIKFSYPVILLGKEIDGIYIEFKEGKAVKAHADKGEDFLRSLLEIDEGARYCGEFGIGTNYSIKIHKHPFDEKIGEPFI